MPSDSSSLHISPSSSPSPSPNSNTHISPITNSPSPIIPSSNTTQSIPPKHTMVTRLKVGVVKPKVLPSLTVSTHAHSFVPTCFSEAMKYCHWQQAMIEEYNALIKNQTWTLIPPNPLHHLIGYKWIFRIKMNPDGTISRYKARLVAQGYKQQYGLDFDQTFSPIIKPAKIRIVLTLATTYDWDIRQLDVKNTFLNGKLSEIVHLKQSLGFSHSDFPSDHCLLQRSLYGLKQAPRPWFQRVTEFLLHT
ncbi:transmembrane signal receptor [Lithospermum erythrorhizon]|uniref:Transmembrane signal receptor n=1 Tax=Lithospermum erythrorhizon TaxID=34254 RepID=A0AAV3P2Z1_LITER